MLFTLFLFASQSANAVEFHTNEENDLFRQSAPIKADDIGIGLHINKGTATIEVENDIEAPVAFVPILGFGDHKITINLNINGGNIVGNIQDSEGVTFTPLRLAYNQKGGSLKGNINFTNNADDEPDFISFSQNATFRGNISMAYGIISFSDTSFTGIIDGSFSQAKNFRGDATRLTINLNGIEWYGGNFLITEASSNPLLIVRKKRNRLAGNILFADVVVKPNAILEFLLPILVRGNLKLEPKAILRYHHKVEISGTFGVQKGAVIESFLGDKLVKKIVATKNFSTEETILTDPLLLEIGEEAPIEGELFTLREEVQEEVQEKPQEEPQEEVQEKALEKPQEEVQEELQKETQEKVQEEAQEELQEVQEEAMFQSPEPTNLNLIPIKQVATNFSHLNSIGLEQRIASHKMAVSGRQNKLEFISTKKPPSQYKGVAIWAKYLLTIGKGKNAIKGKNVGFVIGGDKLGEKYNVGIALGKISSKDNLSDYEYVKANGYTFSIYGSLKPYGKSVTIQSISSYTLQHNKITRNYKDAEGNGIASGGKFKSKILTFENTLGVNFRAKGFQATDIIITPYLGTEDALLYRTAYSETIANSEEVINIPQGNSQRHSSILGVRAQGENIRLDMRWIRAFVYDESGFFYFSRGGAHFIPAPSKNPNSFRTELSLNGEGFSVQSNAEISIFVQKNNTYQMVGLAGIYRIQF